MSKITDVTCTHVGKHANIIWNHASIIIFKELSILRNVILFHSADINFTSFRCTRHADVEEQRHNQSWKLYNQRWKGNLPGSI